MASEPRCSKPGCGALKIVGKPCTDADCPQQWVHHTDTRPAPAATDTGLVTVAHQYRWGGNPKWRYFGPIFADEPRETRALCVRSQADELLAAERAEKEQLRRKMNANDRRAIAAESRLAQSEAELKQARADNAAKDARIKELEAALDSDPSGSDLWRYWSRKACEASQKYVDEVDRSEAIEAKLTAAEAENTRLRNEQSAIAKALAYEPPYQASLAKRAEQLLSHVEHLDGKLAAAGRLLTIWDELPDSTSSAGLMAAWFIKAGTIVREARAVLGGKPS